MSQQSEGKVPPMEDLSAMVDGELAPSLVAGACARWRDDATTRATWHAYQVIGDVLRSEDLASGAAHDHAFLSSLRARLAEEPVVLAPLPDRVSEPVPLDVPAVANARGGAWRAWRAPAAMVAGFAVVATVLVVQRLPGGGLPGATGAPVLAAAPAPAGGVRLASSPARTALPDEAQIVLDGQLIRDARLDDYLAAHKKFGGSSGPGAPSGFLRNAAATSDR